MMPNVPEEVIEQVLALGELKLKCETSRARNTGGIVIGVVVACLGLGLLGVAGYAAYEGHLQNAGLKAKVLAFAAPVALFVVGVIQLSWLIRSRGDVALVYEEGVCHFSRGRVLCFPWKDVEKLQLEPCTGERLDVCYGTPTEPDLCWIEFVRPGGLVASLSRKITLCRKDGIEAKFHATLTSFVELARVLQQNTFRRLWPSCLEQFQKGERVQFGTLEVTREAITFAPVDAKAKTAAWSTVKKVQFLKDKVGIDVSGTLITWAQAPISGIDNPHLFAGLLPIAQPPVS